MSSTSAPRSGIRAVSFVRQSLAGLRVLLLMTLVLGVGYPLAVWGVGQVAFAWQANGSLVTADGTHVDDVTTAPGAAPVVGSAIIGQDFGTPATDPGWFHGRPSAAGDGYDTLASGGSNLGPENLDLVATIEERRAALAAADGVDPASVPADALTASASGLDPDVSPAYAREQVDRVAEARGLPVAEVRALVEDHVRGRALGVLGDPTVRVLDLNIALDALDGGASGRMAP